LSTINKRSEVELSFFNISKQRIRKIEIRKQKQGEFKSLEDILELDGFGVKVLERFCDSILTAESQSSDDKEDKSAEKQPGDEEAGSQLLRKKQTYVTPAVLEGFRQSITSCVALHVDLNCIAWTKLSLAPDDDDQGGVRPIFVDEWMCHQIGNDDKKRSLSDLIQILVHLNDRIPSADTYIVENQPTPQAAKQPGSPVQLNINVQKAQLVAMVCMLMASRNHNGKAYDQSSLEETPVSEAKKRVVDQQRIFFLRSFLASRLYKIYIGKERVSTEHVIDDIFRYNYNQDEPTNYSFSSIDVPSHLRECYEQGDKIEREYMGQSMLLGLTFLKLCVLKCAQSIKTLNKRSSSIKKN
jgi:transcription elongation factor, mitochondrial